MKIIGEDVGDARLIPDVELLALKLLQILRRRCTAVIAARDNDFDIQIDGGVLELFVDRLYVLRADFVYKIEPQQCRRARRQWGADRSHILHRCNTIDIVVRTVTNARLTRGQR